MSSALHADNGRGEELYGTNNNRQTDVQPAAAGEHDEEQRTRSHLRLATLNIRGNLKDKLSRAVQFARKNEIDLLVLTETKTTVDEFDENNAAFIPREQTGRPIEGYTVYANGYSRNDLKEKAMKRMVSERHKELRNNEATEQQLKEEEEKLRLSAQPPTIAQGGVAMIIENKLRAFLVGNEVIREDDRRTLRASFRAGSKTLVVWGVYAPSDRRDRIQKFWNNLTTKVEMSVNKEDTIQVVIGDMNAYLDPAMDKRYAAELEQQQTETTPGGPYPAFVDACQLTDAFRFKHPLERQYSFVRKAKDGDGSEGYAAQSRIDAALISDHAVEAVVDCTIEDFTLVTTTPDHRPVFLDLRRDKIEMNEEKTCKKRGKSQKKDAERKMSINRQTMSENNILRYQTTLDEMLLDGEAGKKIQENLRKLESVKPGDEGYDGAHVQRLLDTVTQALVQTVWNAAVIAFSTTPLRDDFTMEEKREIRSIEEKRQALKRLHKLFGATHSVESGRIHLTKNFQKLTRSDGEYIPEMVRYKRPVRDEADLRLLRRQIAKVQKRLAREIDEAELTRKRAHIDKCIEQIDEDAEEKNSRFFARANPSNANQHMTSVSVTDEQTGAKKVLTEPKEVSDEIRTFWQKLFRTKPGATDARDGNAAAASANTPQQWERLMADVAHKIRPQASQIMAAVDLQELDQVARSCKKGKATGSDSIPIECIQHSSVQTKTLLAALFSCCLRHRQIPNMWKDGVIFTIFKGGDSTNCNDYRPITLLQATYKLLTKIINERMWKLIEQANVLTNAQAGWRTNRSTHNKIQLLIEAIADAKKKKKEIHVTYIDLKKAFDSVDHGQLANAIRLFGFNEHLVEFIMNCNRGTRCCVTTAWGMTEKFDIERGVRQGDPLSPLLFIIYVEPLLRWLEASNDEPYRIELADGTEVRVNSAAFADDMCLVSASAKGMEAKWTKIKAFYEANKMEISNDDRKRKEKTVYTTNVKEENRKARLTLGNKQIPSLPPEESYKYLGVYINLDLTWDEQAAVTKAKVTRMAGYLRHRAFTVRQTVTICNTVILPSILYRARVIRFSKEQLNQMIRPLHGLVYKKLGLHPNSGKHYLYARMQEMGVGLKNIEHEADVAFASHLLSYGHRNSDADVTRLVLAKTRAGPIKITPHLEIVANTVSQNRSEQLKLNQWLPTHIVKALKDAKVSDNIEELLANGKLRDIQWWRERRLQRHYQTVRQVLAPTFDGETAHLDLRIALGTGVKPNLDTKAYEYNGELEAFTDGSFSHDEDTNRITGGFGIVITKNGSLDNALAISVPIQIPRSSLETELRAIRELVFSIPEQTKLTVYTDSQDCIDMIKARLSGTDVSRPNVAEEVDDDEMEVHVHERAALHHQPNRFVADALNGAATPRRQPKKVTDARHELLALQVAEALKTRWSAGGTTKLVHVYAHLLDERSSLSASVKADRKQKMCERFGRRADLILRANQRADVAAKQASQSLYNSSRMFNADDPTLVIKVEEQTLMEESIRVSYIDRMVSRDVQANRRSHPQAYLWENDNIDPEASDLLWRTNSRKLERHRNFLFKLRNDRLPTRARMYERHGKYDSQKSEHNTHSFKGAVSYGSPSCPHGCAHEETLQHILSDCEKTAQERTTLVEQIAEKAMSALEVQHRDDRISKMLKNLLTPATREANWHSTWGWFGCIPKSLRDRCRNIWKTEESAFEKNFRTLVTHFQTEIMSAVQVLWKNRCKALFAEETRKKRVDEVYKKMKEKRSQPDQQPPTTPRQPPAPQLQLTPRQPTPVAATTTPKPPPPPPPTAPARPVAAAAERTTNTGSGNALRPISNFCRVKPSPPAPAGQADRSGQTQTAPDRNASAPSSSTRTAPRAEVIVDCTSSHNSRQHPAQAGENRSQQRPPSAGSNRGVT